jgi:hypothetical protein
MSLKKYVRQFPKSKRIKEALYDESFYEFYSDDDTEGGTSVEPHEIAPYKSEMTTAELEKQFGGKRKGFMKRPAEVDEDWDDEGSILYSMVLIVLHDTIYKGNIETLTSKDWSQASYLMARVLKREKVEKVHKILEANPPTKKLVHGKIVKI